MTSTPQWMIDQLSHCCKPESNRLPYKRPPLTGLDKTVEPTQEKTQ